MHPTAANEPSTPPEHGQLIGYQTSPILGRVEASFWADISKLDLLTNILWTAALEEQETDLHLVMCKTSDSYHLERRAEADRWKSADAVTHQ
jgi:hypothetical protein